MRERVFDWGDRRFIYREKPSRILKPPKILARGQPSIVRADWIDWDGEFHHGTLRHFEHGSPFGGGPYAVLGISNNDQTARHDWREFQQLKTLLLGPHWEAVELYPAEGRLIDTSNRFYLWCFPQKLPWGLPDNPHGPTRTVDDLEDAQAPQRPFPR